MVELGVAGGDLRALGMHAVLGQQVDPVLLDAEVGAEAAAAVHHLQIGAVEHRLLPRDVMSWPEQLDLVYRQEGYLRRGLAVELRTTSFVGFKG